MKSLLKRMGRKKSKRGSQDGRGSVSESVGDDQISENASVHSSAASSFRSERAMTQDEEFLSFDSEPSIKAAPPTIPTNKSVSPRSMQEHPLHLDTSVAVAGGDAGLTPVAQVLPTKATNNTNNNIEVAEGWLLPQTPAAPPQFVNNSDLLSLNLSMSGPDFSGGNEAVTPSQLSVASNLEKAESGSIQTPALNSFGDWPTRAVNGSLPPPAASSSEPHKANEVTEVHPTVLEAPIKAEPLQSSDLVAEPLVDISSEMKPAATVGTIEPIIDVWGNDEVDNEKERPSAANSQGDTVTNDAATVTEASSVEQGLRDSQPAGLQEGLMASHDEQVLRRADEDQPVPATKELESIGVKDDSIMPPLQTEPLNEKEVEEVNVQQQSTAVKSSAGDDQQDSINEPVKQEEEELSEEYSQQEQVAIVEEVSQPIVQDEQVEEVELTEDWPQEKEPTVESNVGGQQEAVGVDVPVESDNKAEVTELESEMKGESAAVEGLAEPIMKEGRFNGQATTESSAEVSQQPTESAMPEAPSSESIKVESELSEVWPQQTAAVEPAVEAPPQPEDADIPQQEADLVMEEAFSEDWPEQTAVEPTIESSQPEEPTVPEVERKNEELSEAWPPQEQFDTRESNAELSSTRAMPEDQVKDEEDLSEDWPQEQQTNTAIQPPVEEQPQVEEPVKPSEIATEGADLSEDWPQEEPVKVESSMAQSGVQVRDGQEEEFSEDWPQQQQTLVEPTVEVQQATPNVQQELKDVPSAESEQAKQDDEEDLHEGWPLQSSPPPEESPREVIDDAERPRPIAKESIEDESNQVSNELKDGMSQHFEESKEAVDNNVSPSVVEEPVATAVVEDEPVVEDSPYFQQQAPEAAITQQQQPIESANEREDTSVVVEQQEPLHLQEPHDSLPWAASFEDEQDDIERQQELPQRQTRVESEDSFHDVAWSPTGDKTVSSTSASKLPASPIPRLGGGQKKSTAKATVAASPGAAGDHGDVEESKTERGEEGSPNMQERTTLLRGNEKKQQSKAGAIASKLFKNTPGSGKHKTRKSGQVVDEELGLAIEEDDVEDEDVTSSPTPLQVISGDETTPASWFRRVCYPKRPILVCIVLFILSLIIARGVGKSSASSVSDSENPIKQAADENVRRLQMALGDTKPVIISTVGSNRDGLRAVQTVLSSLGMQIPDNVPYNGLTLRTKDDIVFKAKFKRVLTNSLNPDDGLMFEERSAAVTGSLVEWHLGRAFVAGLINATFEAIPPELRTGKHWGIAHPRAGYLLPYFKSVLGGPENFIFMQVVRNGVLVASSTYEEFRHLCRLVKLDSYCENQAENKLNFWADMNSDAYHWAKRTLDVDHYIVVRAEDFITGNKECIMRVAKILGMDPSDEVLDAAIEAGKKARDQFAGFDDQGPSEVEDALQTLPDVQSQMEFWGYDPKDSTKMMECKSQEWF